MIIGLGIDIIDNRRIEKTIKKYGYRFKKRFRKHRLLYGKAIHQTRCQEVARC